MSTLQYDYYVSTTGDDDDSGSSQDPFATIARALEVINQYTFDRTVTIHVEAGSYSSTSAITINHVCGAKLVIEGDTRTEAGKHFSTTGSITKSGDDCTITLSSAPTTGWDTSGEYVAIGGATTAANSGIFPVVSRSGAAITYTNASGSAEAVVTQTKVVLCPNVVIERSSSGTVVQVDEGSQPYLKGLTIKTTQSSSCALNVIEQSRSEIEDVVLSSSQSEAVRVAYSSSLKCVDNVSVVKSGYGFYALYASSIEADSTYVLTITNQAFIAVADSSITATSAFVGNADTGVFSQFSSHIDASSIEMRGITNIGIRLMTSSSVHGVSATIYMASGSNYGMSVLHASAAHVDQSLVDRVSNSADGFLSGNQSYIFADNCTAQNCNNGYHSYNNSWIEAMNADGNNSGNTTDRTPAGASPATGNNGAYIVHS